jgi:hypothetical protein
MDSIVGRWSTGWFYHDPADEVLVFFPDGSGVFEYYWWKLTYYETFDYRVEESYLYATGKTQYRGGSETKMVEETHSDLSFSGRFQIREPRSEELASGCGVILEFDKPLISALPATEKLGRRISDADVSAYRLPTFDE